MVLLAVSPKAPVQFAKEVGMGNPAEGNEPHRAAKGIPTPTGNVKPHRFLASRVREGGSGVQEGLR